MKPFSGRVVRRGEISLATLDHGFYYDMKLPRSLTEADFPAIEAEMAKLIKADEPFERIEEPRDKALELCRELHQEFKVEHIQEGLAGEKELLIANIKGVGSRTASATGHHSSCAASQERDPGA